MDKPVTRGVPKIILVIIPVILAAMYYYAAFIDTSAPENTVQEYYQASFENDFNTVAGDLSVLLAARLPQYANLSPQELLAKRADVEADMATLISNNGSKSAAPQNITVEIMKDYTKMGKNAAMVAYAFKRDDKEQSLGVALLIKEQGKFRIYDLSPINKESLPQIKDFNINRLDAQVTNLFQQKK